jgi:Zn-finger nucleic acid-binding protein
MRTVEYEGVQVEACDACGGHFLDADELGMIVRRREEQFSPEACQAIAEAGPIEGVPMPELEREVECPACSGAMMPFNYSNDSGIILDRCPDCGGYWLDAKELEKAQMAVEGWEARVPQVVERFKGEFTRIEMANDDVGKVSPCRIPVIGGFINAVVSGIVRLTD